VARRHAGLAAAAAGGGAGAFFGDWEEESGLRRFGM
jgi:hypothetical protein